MFVHVVGHLADQIHGWQAPNLGGRFNGAKYTEWADAWQPHFQKRCDGTDFQQRRSHPAMLTPAMLATLWRIRPLSNGRHLIQLLGRNPP